MTERRIRHRHVCVLAGRLMEIWLTVDQTVARGFAEPFASYGAYVEATPADHGRRDGTAAITNKESFLEPPSAEYSPAVRRARSTRP